MSSEESHKKTRAEQTKDHIRHAFYCLMRKKPWDKISVKELCTETSITRGTFYNYFTDIYDLMESVQDPLIEELSQRMDHIVLKNYRSVSPEDFFLKFDYRAPECFQVWFHFCTKHKEELVSLMDPRFGSQHFIYSVRKILEKNLHALMDCEKLPRDDMRTYYVSILVTMHFELARIWVDSGTDLSKYSEQDMISILNAIRIGSAFKDARHAADVKRAGSSA